MQHALQELGMIRGFVPHQPIFRAATILVVQDAHHFIPELTRRIELPPAFLFPPRWCSRTCRA